MSFEKHVIFPGPSLEKHDGNVEISEDELRKIYAAVVVKEATLPELQELEDRMDVDRLPDRLGDMFERQKQLMQLLIDHDKLPEHPIDITSKMGQRQIKELTWAMVEEMAEASYILKNRSHRFTDATDVDFAHFKEELADALAYFIEICVFAGIGPDELFAEYCAKNALVKDRVKQGY